MKQPVGFPIGRGMCFRRVPKLIFVYTQNNSDFKISCSVSPAVTRWPLTAKARLGSGGPDNIRFGEVKLAPRQVFS